MRFWQCLLLAACADPQPAAVPTPAPIAALAPKVAPPPMTAVHGAEITALGLTADGGAVASADALGGIRLWTVLDGTREPVVIHGAAPRSIALTRDGDGFAIGVLDAAGGVHVIRTSATGAVRERVTVRSDQPASEIDGTGEGLLILRADQTLDLVDAGGAVRSHLVPEPGTHIDSILVRGRRVLALVQEDKQLRGRWIVLDRGATWGESTPKLAVKIAHAVLSPDGDQLAASRPRSLHPVLIDLATGAALKTPLCVTRAWPDESGDGDVDETEFLRGDNAPVPLGFLSSTMVACSVVGMVQWWNVSTSQSQTYGGSLGVRGAPVAMSDRALVIGTGPNLAMTTPTLNRFLGYGVRDVALMRTGAGVLVSTADQQSLVLDGELRERARFELGRSRVDWSDVVMIDDRYAIVASPRRSPATRSESIQVSVIDGVTRAQHQVLPYEVRDRELAYEPTTRLLAASDGAASLLLELDPASHTFGKAIRLANAITPTRLVVLDPQLSGGIAALALDRTADGLLVGELHRDDLVPGTLLQPRTSYRVPGELRAFDRAGRLYMHEPVDRDDVVIYVRGAVASRLRGVGSLALRPSPDGSRIAAFESPRLALYTAAGEVRWDTAQWSASDIGWSAAGELFLQLPSAIAKVDLETGALTTRRCGLAFGLTDTALISGRSGPTICDAAR